MRKLDFTVAGAPRSGTSLLSSLIDRHPKVRIAHDTGLYYYLKFTFYFLVNLLSLSSVYIVFRIYGYSRLNLLIYLFLSSAILIISDRIRNNQTLTR